MTDPATVCWSEVPGDDYGWSLEGGVAIVFAPTEEAARAAVREYHAIGDGDYEDCAVKREPQWDRFAATKQIPIDAFLAAGWHIQCVGCERKIDGDGVEPGEGDYDDEGNLPPDREPVGTHESPFCSRRCQEKDAEDRRQRKADKDAARRAFVRITGGIAEPRDVSSRQPDGTVHVRFRMPGAIADGEFRYDHDRNRGSFWINPHDRRPFRLFRNAARAAADEWYADGNFAGCDA